VHFTEIWILCEFGETVSIDQVVNDPAFE